MDLDLILPLSAMAAPLCRFSYRTPVPGESAASQIRRPPRLHPASLTKMIELYIRIRGD